MNATVVMFNIKSGMAAAKTPDGDYVIIELLGEYEIEIGHDVSHYDFTSMGRNKYLNLTTGETMEVYVQNLSATAEQAKEQCLF
jgi:hypothetical protein